VIQIESRFDCIGIPMQGEKFLSLIYILAYSQNVALNCGTGGVYPFPPVRGGGSIYIVFYTLNHTT